MNILRPEAAKIYNMYMERAGPLDALLEFHRIRIRPCNWYHKTAFHVLDLGAANA